MTTASTTSDGTKEEADERLGYRGLGQRLLLRPEFVGLLAALLLYSLFWGVSQPFGKAGGTATVLDVTATLGIMAVAVGVLMIGGEFDLSSGAMTGTMGIIIILMVKETGDLGGAGINYWIAIPLSLVIALAVGWINGTLVERMAVPSFIVTLGTFFVLRGLKLAGSKIITEQISVGRADEGAGYDFWNNIFGSEWQRQDHIWEGRDAVYTALVLIGGAILVMAIFEFAFRRNEVRNQAGLPILGLGLGGVGLGVGLLHGLDGTDWLPMLAIAGGGLAASYGLATWRFSKITERGSASLVDAVTRPFAISGALLVVAVLAALVFDPTDDSDVVRFVTEQGLRAILFLGLVGAAAAWAMIGLNRARDGAPAAKAVAVALVSVTIFVMALFVQSESTGSKFRSELFAILCVVSLLFLCWAVVSYFFETRRFEDTAADALARRASLVGIILIGFGILIRLLFAIQEEIIREDPSRLAKFSIRIVWFMAFTALMSYILTSTPFGSWIYAVGGNKEAARSIGVPAARTKTQLFMIVAGAAWLVGILLAFRLNSIQAGTGNGEEFEYIIAAVVGGTLLTGGYGSAAGAAIGALIAAMSQQGISFAGWNTDWRFVFLGAILLIAVAANTYVRKLAEALR